MSTAANARAEGNHRDTSDPSVASEPTGPIASDSLAAESLQSGGDFAAGNSSATAMGVPGSKSTLATTDTSAAVPLPPAASGAARERAEAKGLGADERGVSGVKYPDAAAGQPASTGTTTSEGHYYGGPSADRQGAGYTTQAAAGASDFGATTTTTAASGDSGSGISSTSGVTSSSSSGGGGSGPPTGTGVRPHVDAAPTYAARVSGAIAGEGDSQPKGSNLTEGGDVPESHKTYTGNVDGGSKDPGRLAQAKFEGINAQISDAGGPGRGKEGTTEEGGRYGALESERI